MDVTAIRERLTDILKAQDAILTELRTATEKMKTALVTSRAAMFDSLDTAARQLVHVIQHETELSEQGVSARRAPFGRRIAPSGERWTRIAPR